MRENLAEVAHGYNLAMSEIDRERTHWDTVYATRGAENVSWYASKLDTSLRLIARFVPPAADIVDVGGGASTLARDLAELGHHVTVVDLSQRALDEARRSVPASARVEWILGDIRSVELPAASSDCWHDRAALHFLKDDADVAAYRTTLLKTLRRGGIAIISGFAPEGPTRCSGLEVARRSADDMHRAVGDSFAIEASGQDAHTTPGGSSQLFQWVVFRRIG